MRIKFYSFVIGTIFLMVAVNLLFTATPANSAPDLSKAIRPTVDPGDSGGGGGGGGAGGAGGEGEDGQDGGGPLDSACASVTGQVLTWGGGGTGDVAIELRSGSWQTFTISADDGNYGLGGLGIGTAVLHVGLAPGEQFQPLIQDAGVYLNCDFPIIANIALFNGPRIDPPATIEISASEPTIVPGQSNEITLTVNNDLPNEITNVVVTDLLPPGLNPVEVSTSAGPEAVQIVNANASGQLVVVNLDKVAAEATATIRMTIVADEVLLPASQVRNTATLFYRESAADQGLA